MSQNQKLPIITGIGSVSPFGTIAGPIPQNKVEPVPITAWPTEGLRRAFLVTPFNPAAIVPGLKTRRLDRLSAWALVAASLALQDAGLNPEALDQIDRSRVAVVFGTDFGCMDLTEAFFHSANANGWGGTDPITFPETLANSAPGHVALRHNLRGPNITVSSKNFSAECALLQGASLLRHGQADIAVVIAGDTLTRTIFEWYETARLLSPSCFNPDTPAAGYIPSEAVVAMVLETEDAPASARNRRTYAGVQTGRYATAGDPATVINQMLNGTVPTLTIAAGNGIPCTTTPSTYTPSPAIPTIPANPVALGIPDSGGLLHLALALSTNPPPGLALMLATSGNNGYAALMLNIP